MNLREHMIRLNQYLDDVSYRAQFKYGAEELRLELLETADLLFEVADKVEAELSELMIGPIFDLPLLKKKEEERE